jgi:hypothetical protein
MAQTNTYNNLVLSVEALAGENLLSAEKARLNFWSNRRAYVAYRESDLWQRFLVVGEERAYTASTSIIPYSEGVLNNIDTFLRVHQASPYSTQSAQPEYTFYVDQNGANVVNQIGSEAGAFVTYKKEFNEFYDTASTNDKADGDYYAQRPTGMTTSSDIPGEWWQYIAYGSYVDLLRSDGQNEKAQAEERQARDLLQIELEKIDRQHTGNTISRRIRTHVNTAGRSGAVPTR